MWQEVAWRWYEHATSRYRARKPRGWAGGDGWCRVRLEAWKRCQRRWMWWEWWPEGWRNERSMLQLEMSQNGHTSCISGRSARAVPAHDKQCTWAIQSTSQAPQAILLQPEPATSTRTIENATYKCQHHQKDLPSHLSTSKLNRANWMCCIHCTWTIDSVGVIPDHDMQRQGPWSRLRMSAHTWTAQPHSQATTLHIG